MIVMKQFRKRGHWSLLLALALIPALTSCLESDQRPTLDAQDLATVEDFGGIYGLFPDSKSDNSTDYWNFEPRPNNRYAISAITWTPGSSQKVVNWMDEAVFVPLKVNEPGSQAYLLVAIGTNSNKTFYQEFRKTGTNFFVGLYDLPKDEKALDQAKTIAQKKGIILSSRQISGSLSSHVLKELFSDPEFRKTLEIEYIQLRILSSKDAQAIASASLQTESVASSAGASGEAPGADSISADQSKTGESLRAPDVTDLLQQLRAKVTSDGPFDLPIYERLAATFQKADAGQAQSQELLANARDFAAGKVRASMFVTYLKDALPPGTTSPQSTSTSLHWLRQKTLSGDLWAKYFLARAYYTVAAGLRGKEMASSFEAMGLPEEIRDHWEIYRFDIGDLDFRGSYEEAAKLAEEGAVKGSPPLTYLLGAMTLDGLGVAKDETKGLKLIRQAAEGGFPLAMLALGKIYRDGDGVSKDEAASVRWYQKAADLGNATAMRNLGGMYGDGRGVPRDEAAAVHWYQKAAELGDADAMNNLGVRYMFGRGVPRDEVAAVRWYQKGAELGNADAMYNLGAMYANGRGITKDEAAAVRWFQKAAELGTATAMTDLGMMYFRGHGVPKDEVAGVRWFQKGAELGDTTAMVLLGLSYVEGQGGLPKDEVAGVRWVQKSAELGNATAMNSLGLMYEKGRGVGHDVKLALEWYEKAAKLGNESGKEAAQRLQAAMPGSTWKSPQEWAARYKNAPTIDRAEFLKRLPPVRLEVRANAEFLEVVPLRTFQIQTISAIQNQGIKFDDNSPVTLRITFYARATKFVETIERQSSRYGSSTDTDITPVLTYLVSMESILPATILRNGHFHRLNVTTMQDTRWAYGKLSTSPLKVF
jgi:TPR repeat protein